MIVVLSPTKNLNLKPSPESIEPTLPDFLEDSAKLVNHLKRKSIKSLESLFSVNNKIASLNKERFQNWRLPFTAENAKPAIHTFRGEVFIGLNAADFNEEELAYAQQHLRILSGLYGVLRPLDLMQPYRLEMGTQLKIGRKNSLYEFWDKKIADTIEKELNHHQAPVLINLASVQYFKSIQLKHFNRQSITPSFYERRNGRRKSIHVYAKRARGLMANYIIKNRLEDPEDIKQFDVDGYRYEKEGSTKKEWIFIRPDSRGASTN